MKVKIKKLVDNAVVPTYGKPGDAGMDLTAISIQVTSDGTECQYIEYGTGISLEIPDGYVGLLYPRSSISKTGLILANSVGVVDSGYRGEVKLRFKKFSDSIYKVGERVAQIMIVPHPTIEFVEEQFLSETERGTGGFGSTNTIDGGFEGMIDAGESQETYGG